MFTLTLGVGLFAIAAGLGGRLLKAGGLQTDGSLEALLFWTATGFGALATAIVVAGLVFGVGPAMLLTVSAGAALLGWREVRQLPSLILDALSYTRAHADRFSISIFLLIAAILTLRALAPPVDWDALMYHLRVPQQFLAAGEIYRPEDNAHIGFVGLPHMTYLLLLALGSPSGPALVSACFTLGLTLAGFALAARFLDLRTAGLSLAVLWGSTILVHVAITPRTDTILAFYLLLVHYALLRARESQDARLLYVGAALAGMAVGVKYNALLYVVTLAPPLGLWLVATRVRRPLVTVALMLGISLVTALPWLIKNQLLLGDPLYPYLGGRQVDPWLAGLAAAGDVAPALPATLEPTTFDVARGGPKSFNLVDFFIAPHRITVEGEGRTYYPNLVLLFLPLWLLFLKDRALAWLGGPALGYVGLVLLLQPRTSLRYLIPALAPLTLVALHCYGRVWDRLVSAGRARLLLRATTVLAVAGSVLFMLWQITNRAGLAHLGFAARETLLRRGTGDYADVVTFVNTRLPERSRVLMLFESRGYYFRVPVLQDNVLMNWPVLVALGKGESGTDESACLRSTGVTHVLVNKGVLRYYEGRGFTSAPLRLDAFEAFAPGCLDSIFATDRFTLFKVRSGAPGRPSTR